jgi:predicted methyltransferase MtxX (methanogen marker protein 4)
MKMLVFLGHLRGIYDQVEFLHSFLKDEMAAILESIGDMELKSAIAALRDAKSSNNPAREFTSAITCLRTAHESFLSAASKRKFFGFAGPGLDKEEEYYRKATQCAVLIATHYKALGDESLTKRYAATALADFAKYAAVSIAIAEAEDISAARFLKGPNDYYRPVFPDEAEAVGNAKARRLEIVSERKKLKSLCAKLL